MADIERLMVVGSGGREFALIEEAQRAGVPRVYSTRGEDAVNIGIEGVTNTGLGDKDIKAIGSFASQEEIGLVIVGPEAPLIGGLADELRSRGIPTYGPSADGAKFEDDKRVTHDFVKRHGLPNPENSEIFNPEQREEAKDYVRELGPENVYTKRVGQEGGKGAVGYEEDQLMKALAEIDEVFDKGEGLLIQGRLTGPEYSAMYMLDGRGGVVATALSRDHKALYNGGSGPNTGGMGAFAPLSMEQASFKRRQEIERIGLRISDGLREEELDFRGTLYAGLRAETNASDAALKILEFNVRFGDPEMQVLLQSLGGYAIDYMLEVAHGSTALDMSRLYLEAGKEPVTLTVVEAAPGYSEPGRELVTGLPIRLPDNLPDGVSVQFAGARMVDGKPVSSGGRVLNVTGTAPTLEEARSKVYSAIGRDNDGVYLGDDEQVIRTDIGLS